VYLLPHMFHVTFMQHFHLIGLRVSGSTAGSMQLPFGKRFPLFAIILQMDIVSMWRNWWAKVIRNTYQKLKKENRTQEIDVYFLLGPPKTQTHCQIWKHIPNVFENIILNYSHLEVKMSGMTNLKWFINLHKNISKKKFSQAHYLGQYSSSHAFHIIVKLLFNGN
jgi:hypothetical protein